MTIRIKAWTAWKDMWRRVEGKLSPNRYKDRGIKVCKRWESFENFLSDLGYPPTMKHTLDRINNNGHYRPSNCRWATAKEQANNRELKIVIKMPSGNILSLKEACKVYKLKTNTVYAKVYYYKQKKSHQEIFNEYILKQETEK